VRDRDKLKELARATNGKTRAGSIVDQSEFEFTHGSGSSGDDRQLQKKSTRAAKVATSTAIACAYGRMEVLTREHLGLAQRLLWVKRRHDRFARKVANPLD